MRHVFSILLLLATSATATADQRRGAAPRAATATLAILVADAGGSPLSDVRVTVEGGAQRSGRTESGRMAVEELPAGTYLVRFEKDGYVTVERELAARPGKPTEVNVTLAPLPQPPPLAGPAQAAQPAVSAKPMAADLPALIEAEYVGKNPSRSSPLACGAGGTATLIQLNQPLAEHTHESADEFFYVVAGEGTAQVGTGQQRLKAGMFLFVPAGMSHGLRRSGGKPLIVYSTRAGEGCGAQPGR